MGYKKYYKKRNSKPKPWYMKKYKASPYDVAVTAMKGVDYLKGLINSEVCLCDTIGTLSPLYSVGTVTYLTAIAQADGPNHRTGNSIYVRSIDLNMTHILNASAADTLIKYWVVIDTQQNADNAPALADLIQTTGTPNAPLSHLNSATVGRFKILTSRTVALDDSKGIQVSTKEHINLRHHVRFNGANSTDIQRGGIFLITVSNQDTNAPNIYYNARIRYHDN